MLLIQIFTGTKCRALGLLPHVLTGSLPTRFGSCTTGPKEEDPFADWTSSFFEGVWLLKNSAGVLQLLE